MTQEIYFCAVAGGETYKRYADDLMESAYTFFRPSLKINFMVLDGVEGWPNGTLFRYHCLLAQVPARPNDYIFLSDADMRFEAEVGDEVLPPGGITATLHPGYIGHPADLLPFEERRNSAAWTNKRRRYYAGGFVGGRAQAVFEMAKWISRGIMKDIGKGMIARWHDESHLNCYLAECPPSLTLSPAYCHPDNDAYYKTVWPEQYERKLVALDKTNEERGDR